jgi:hypothetical protein
MMNLTKEKRATFTPGPWHTYLSRKNVHRDIASHCGSKIAREVHHANARLIAAAPDLLAQCKLFEKVLNELVVMGEADIEDRDKLREVLAKVEGGEG